ncbi:DUF6907 domain-containing protein [Streptomyces sp. NBC_01236]|uniref:DUF6907 domain-containing protein n=1 Tax=Streptomyces sp. NBC_01236 TaxID=2903789 RepID=UPI002E143419|nr:hypothetical protein OG324_21125 [Streptomyces sp. NBC_01236]
MSDPRTVTVDTSDHGQIEIPEPSWCLGVHPAEGYREDIEHASEPTRLTIETPCHGPVKLLGFSLMQRPFSTFGPTGVVVAAELDEDWDSHEFDSGHLAGLADSLVAYAVGPMHQLIERLQLLEGDQS